MFNFDIFLDSDGCVVDFSGYCLDKYGKLPDNLDRNEKKKFWGWVQWHDQNVEPFFRSMPKMADADELIEYLMPRYRSVKILTAGGFTPKNVGQQKIDWYAEHYPSLEVVVVNKSLDKAKYAAPDAILIDDRTKSTYPWEQAGGIAILHRNAKDTIRQLESLNVA